MMIRVYFSMWMVAELTVHVDYQGGPGRLRDRVHHHCRMNLQRIMPINSDKVVHNAVRSIPGLSAWSNKSEIEPA